MSLSKGNNSNKEEEEKTVHENIFEILDGIMFQLSKTKKTFLIMIITTLIIPPVALLTVASVYDLPHPDRFREDLDASLQSQLDSGEITKEEYDMIKEKISKNDNNKPKELFRPQIIIFAVSVVWLVVGIRQWVVLSKWDRRYQRFKDRQKEIDDEFED